MAMTIKKKQIKPDIVCRNSQARRSLARLPSPLKSGGSDGSRLPSYWTRSLKFRNRQACSLMQKQNFFLQ